MSASGKFVLRIDPALHHKLREQAAAQGVSLNQYCETLLRSGASASAENGVSWIPKEWRKDLIGVALFGSFARGEATAASDTDLLIVFNRDFPVSRALYAEWDQIVAPKAAKRFMKPSPQLVQLPELSQEAGGIWFEAAMDGIVLYEKEYLLSRFFARLRQLVASGDVARKISHGNPYWIKSERSGAA